MSPRSRTSACDGGVCSGRSESVKYSSEGDRDPKGSLVYPSKKKRNITMSKYKSSCVRLLVLSALLPFAAMSPNGIASEKDAVIENSVKTREARIEWWRDARFGMFVHWGPVSLTGKEISWSRYGLGPPKRGKNPDWNHPQVREYDTLYTKWNPVKFDADEWAQIAKDAGMRYVVFVAKHCDGFCLFDSELTDHKITSPKSPFGRDITAEVVKAFREKGLGVGLYYSLWDWRHPDYFTDNHARYTKFMHGQIRELLSNYGKIDIMWFDAWVLHKGGDKHIGHWDTFDLVDMVMKLQPGIIINDRAGVLLDFDTSAEGRVGKYNKKHAWETCMTLGRQWSWKPNDRIKSLKQCIHNLVRVVGGDGNLLLNTGPMPDGRIEPRQAERLREIGQWLKAHGEAIYGTRGGPFPPGKWGASTQKGNKVYIHVLQWPAETLSLPPIPRKVVNSTSMSGGEVSVEQTDKSLIIEVPESDRDPIDTVIVLELDKPVAP